MLVRRLDLLPEGEGRNLSRLRAVRQSGCWCRGDHMLRRGCALDLYSLWMKEEEERK